FCCSQAESDLNFRSGFVDLKQNQISKFPCKCIF
ncbi:unnamed protein product, partial [Prunus brigantina]